jgi:hypothetical protein
MNINKALKSLKGHGTNSPLKRTNIKSGKPTNTHRILKILKKINNIEHQML